VLSHETFKDNKHLNVRFQRNNPDGGPKVLFTSRQGNARIDIEFPTSAYTIKKGGHRHMGAKDATRESVREFYGRAAKEPRASLC
jgi:hypothetical protein